MHDAAETIEPRPAADDSSSAPPVSLWASIRQAVLGTHAGYNYTEGPIGRAIMLLAIPLVLEMLWEIPLAYVLAIHFGLGPYGVFLAVTISFSTLAVVSAAVFRRGCWKAHTI